MSTFRNLVISGDQVTRLCGRRDRSTRISGFAFHRDLPRVVFAPIFSNLSILRIMSETLCLALGWEPDDAYPHRTLPRNVCPQEDVPRHHA